MQPSARRLAAALFLLVSWLAASRQPLADPRRAPSLSPPEVFGPGVISGPANNAAPAIAPDCRSVVFGRSNGADYDLLVTTATDHGFGPARLAPFSGVWRDLEPTFSPDGQRLVFASSRPAAAGGGGQPLNGNWGGKVMPESGGNLWVVERKGDGWGEPQRLPDRINSVPSVFSPSLTASGTLYFMKPTAETGRFHIYRSVVERGEQGPPERLPFNVDEQWSDVDPAVAADESFVVFSSNRPPAAAGDMDLFIVFRSSTAGWGEPEHLGPVVNSAAGEIEARLAPDGHTLYFSSRRPLPLSYPKSPAAAAESLAQMNAWGNGLSHIWRVDLTPVLEAHGTGARATKACAPK